MTCRLNSSVIKGMSYFKGRLTIQFPEYDRTYECDVLTAHQLAYSPEPTKFFNQNIKNKLKVIQ
jgi:hypothetical protein